MHDVTMLAVVVLGVILNTGAALATGVSSSAPYFTVEPRSSVVRRGDSVSLSCVATCTASLPPASESPSHCHDVTITWTHNGLVLDDQSTTSSPSLSYWSSTVDIASFSRSDEGLYQCTANNSVGAVISRPAALLLADLGEFEAEFDTANKTLTVYEWNSVLIDCPLIDSRPPVVWKFLLNGTTLQLRPDHHVILPSGKLFISSVTWSDVGVYQCVAVNSLVATQRVSESRVNVLIQDAPAHQVAARMISKEQREVSVVVGETLTIECVASGWPVPNVTWSRYGGQLSRRHHQHNGLMTVKDVQLLDDGTYLCQAMNGVGAVQSSVVFVHVLMMPVIVSAPSDEVVTEGQSVTLHCQTSAVPAVAVVWRHNGRPLHDGQRTQMTDTSITLTSVTMADAGLYQCIANNVVGSAYATVVLTVTVSQQQRHQPTTSYVTTVTVSSPQPSLLPGSVVGPRQSGQPRGRRQRGRRLRGGRRTPQPPGVMSAADEEERRRLLQRDDDDDDGDKADDGGEDVRADDGRRDGALRSPAAPTVQVLSDTSVMVRWTAVPTRHLGGLNVLFYKVQYRRVGGRRKSRGWETVDEDIPSTKHAIRINQLRSGSRYQFRVVAIYSNHDNKHGPNSPRVRLRVDGASTVRAPQSSPTIVKVYAISSSSILVKWQYVAEERVRVDGFIVLYRRYDAADGSFQHQRVSGSSSRHAVLRQLDTDTAYSIMIRSFNRHGQSELSNTVVMTTFPSAAATRDHLGGMDEHTLSPSLNVSASRPVQRSSYADADEDETDDESDDDDLLRYRRRKHEDSTLYIILGVIVGAVLVGVLTALFICARQQHKQRLLLAAAAQVNSSVVHRVYSNSARPLLASSAAVISRHHKLPATHRRGSAGSAVGDVSNIPSSSVTTETMVECSHASSNSSSESSDRHLYDCPHAPGQTVQDRCISDDDDDDNEKTALRPSVSDMIEAVTPGECHVPRLTSSCCDIKITSSDTRDIADTKHDNVTTVSDTNQLPNNCEQPKQRREKQKARHCIENPKRPGVSGLDCGDCSVSLPPESTV